MTRFPRSASPAALGVLLLAVGAYVTRPFAQTPTAGDEIVLGGRIFESSCARCHGPTGRGDGPDARRLDIHPRDFMPGAFRCRCTAAGEPASDEDLLRTVTKGLPGTPMPAHEGTLSDVERRAVVQYVKTLSKAFAAGNLSSCPAAAVPPADDLTAEGKALYGAMQCAQCHGADGRGDGPAAASLNDYWGNPIKPHDFVGQKAFKCGMSDADMFRTLQTGMTGSPMPSFVQALGFGTDGMSAEEKKATIDRRTWALVQYVRSLGR